MLTTVMNGARQSPGSAGATDTAADDRTRSRPNRADDHSAVNTPCEPPRTRPTATPSPGPALTSPARRAYCVISAIRFAYGWRADGGPAGARVGLRALALSGTIAPAAQDLTGVPSWPASRSRDVLESQ